MYLPSDFYLEKKYIYRLSTIDRVLISRITAITDNFANPPMELFTSHRYLRNCGSSMSASYQRTIKHCYTQHRGVRTRLDVGK